MDSSEGFIKSDKLRGYIIGFRFFALFLGLILTAFNNPSEITAIVKFPLGGGMHYVLPLFLILYHCLAALWFWKFHASKANMVILILSDVISGFLTCTLLGSSYLLLAIALPVIESAYSDFPWMIILIALSILACILTIVEYFGIMNIVVPQDDPEAGKIALKTAKSKMLLRTSLFFVFSTVSSLWAYLVALRLEAEKVFLYKQSQEEKNLIVEDTLHDKETIQGLSNALIEKENEIEKYKSKMTETRDELEKNYKKYHDQKNQYIAQSELFREKENEINQIFEKRSKKMEQDVLEYKKQSDKARSLLGLSIEINKSLNLQEVYVLIIENCIKLIPVQTCIIFILDTVEGHTQIFAEMVYSPYSDFFRNFSLRMGEGLPGIVAEKQRSIIVDSGSVNIEGKDYQTLLTYEKSALVVPILYEEEVLGVLYLGKQENFAFTPDMQELANTYARLAAVPLQNAQLFQKTISGGIFDDLTSLYNSIYFNERFGEEIKRSKRYQSNLSILLVDIDNFVPMNNDLGSAWGDDVLKETAEVVRAHTRETDVAARVQAGQFVVLLLQSDKTNAGLIGERIRTAFEMRNMARMKRSRGSTTISVGVANFPTDADGRDELIAAVEKALKKSKGLGGNKTTIAEPLNKIG